MCDCSQHISPLQQSMLRADLGFFDSALPESMQTYLDGLLVTAMTRLLEDCGITIDPETYEGASISEMYAAWLYRKRATGEAKPPMLQIAIRDAQIRQARGRME